MVTAATQMEKRLKVCFIKSTQFSQESFILVYIFLRAVLDTSHALLFCRLGHL